MPARRKLRSERRNPQGSIMSSPTPRQAPSRIRLPAFWGISDSYRARRTKNLPFHTRLGLIRHFLRHRAARPSKIDSLFYRRNEQAAWGPRRVTASVPYPCLFVARVQRSSFQVFPVPSIEGGPSGSYDE